MLYSIRRIVGAPAIIRVARAAEANCRLRVNASVGRVHFEAECVTCVAGLWRITQMSVT